MAKRIIWLLIVVVVLFGGLFGTKFYQIDQKKNMKKTMPAMTIAASTVIEESWQQTIPSIGSLVADSGIYVANEVAGTVSAIHFQSGQQVERGQLLIELDWHTGESELDSLKASSELAKIQLDRQGKLLKTKSVSKDRYDETRTLLNKARAEVNAKIAYIAKKKIRASFAGELGIRQVDVGQYLSVGSAIVSLQKLSPIHVDFSIPERYLSSLYKGQAVEVKVQAYPTVKFKGEVTAFNPDVDVASRSLKVRATLTNSDGRLRPGMFADVDLLHSATTSLKTLPDTAISYNPYGNYVFLITELDSKLTVQRQQITVGATYDGRVEILSGLELGDVVVSAGQNKLRNNMAVIIAELPAPGERTHINTKPDTE
jgi:membrane fusion protein (multidrug efflux system)